MIRLLVPGLAEAADVGTMRRLVRARRSERSARQSESVKGEPRFRRRPRRRPLSANPWQERWACRPWSSPTCATVRLASGTPNASNGSRLTASSPYALSSSPPSSPSWPSSPYCPPSRGSWRYRNSAVANRVHCAPITTAQRKKQRIRLTNGGQRASVASNGRRVDSLIRACATCASAFIASRDRNFR
jgi:hypothetical protein